MKSQAIRQWLLIGIGCLLVFPGGCGLVGPSPRQTPPGERLEAFLDAGPMQFTLDEDVVYRARPEEAEYRVQTGDLLELQMPATVQTVTDDLADSGRIEQMRTVACRVAGDGTVTLPIIGAVSVQGKTLLEIEAAIRNAYFPRYVVSPPAVITSVKEYRTHYVSITGAVRSPGSYPLRADRMTLIGLLMEAGGIVESGAAVIRITEPAEQGETASSEPILMPVKGLNIPFADVALKPGALVEVQAMEARSFTVVGLVRQPGTFPYPANARFSLPQALAFSGGVNPTADPRYVHIYRPAADGQIYDAVFSLRPGPEFTQAMAVAVKPGDVIAVEQTPQTRRNLLVSDILQMRLNAGLTYTP